MEYSAKFAAVAQMSHNLLDFTVNFCHLAVTNLFIDETLKSLFWIGANYLHPVDLPDTSGLNRRDAIIRRWRAIARRNASARARGEGDSADPQWLWPGEWAHNTCGWGYTGGNRDCGPADELQHGGIYSHPIPPSTSFIIAVSRQHWNLYRLWIACLFWIIVVSRQHETVSLTC